MFGRVNTVRGRVGLVLAALLAFAFPARAQAGFSTERHPELGLTLPLPRSYEALPIAPSEDLVVLQFVERAGGTGATRAQLGVVWIERPQRQASAELARARIDTLEGFVAARYRGAKLGAAASGKEQRGYKAREFTFPPGAAGERALWLYAWESEPRTIAFVGTCEGDALVEQVKLWRHCAENLEIKEPQERDEAKLRQLYANKPLRGIEQRIAVRRALVRGWKAEDTDNYIVLYDTPDQALVRSVMRDLEILRLEYARLFPPFTMAATSTTAATSAADESIGAVRLCRDRDGFLAYGGRDDNAGYWNVADRELVLYDAHPGGGRPDADTFVALYHEGFHQYMHAAFGDLPLHPWFSEGHGDYFSGAQLENGKLRSFGVHPWRIAAVRSLVADRAELPWRTLLGLVPAEFSAPERVVGCYAQSWSMIHFLRNSEEVARTPAWSRILSTYFDTLRATWTAELAKLDASAGGRARAGIESAVALARSRALDAAFEDVDLDAIENAWRAYVLALPATRRR